MQIIYKYPNGYATDSDSGKMYMVPLDFSEFVKPIFGANPNVDYIQLTVNSYVMKDSKTCLYENNSGDKCYKSFYILAIDPAGIAFYKEKPINSNFDIKKELDLNLLERELSLLNNKIKKEESKDKFVEIFKDVYKKIYIKQKRLNERNNKYNFRIINEALNTFLKSPSKKTFRDFLKTIYLNYEAKHRFEFKKWFTRDYGSIKNAPSFVLHYKHLIEWLDKNNDKKTFAYLHFDDFHNPSAFFTYDSEDEEVLRNEAQDILNYLKTLHKNYKGNVVTDLSLLYVDKQIGNFFKELEKRNLLDSTTVLITADHGYPYNLYPIREDYGNAMYLENYHVPCIIVDKEYKNAICDTYQSTYDVPATLCDIANIDKPKEFIGNSIVKKHEGKDCVIFEYLGGGCPDLSRRPIHYGCFNEKMFIKVIVNINDEITEKNIVKVFDLEKDPLEYKNLVKKIKMNDERVQFLLSKLKTRHSNIIKV